jgi:hypothetical protein
LKHFFRAAILPPDRCPRNASGPIRKDRPFGGFRQSAGEPTIAYVPSPESPRPGGACSPMLFLEISLIALALLFFASMDRYLAACERL